MVNSDCTSTRLATEPSAAILSETLVIAESIAVSAVAALALVDRDEVLMPKVVASIFCALTEMVLPSMVESTEVFEALELIRLVPLNSGCQ